MLDASDNPITEDFRLPPPHRGPALEELCLDAPFTATGPEALAQLTSLSRLHLRAPSQFASVREGCPWAALLRAVARLPALRLLCLDRGLAQEVETEAAAAATYSASRRRPGLVMDEAGRWGLQILLFEWDP